jgi:hypothetical protein
VSSSRDKSARSPDLSWQMGTTSRTSRAYFQRQVERSGRLVVSSSHDKCLWGRSPLCVGSRLSGTGGPATHPRSDRPLPSRFAAPGRSGRPRSQVASPAPENPTTRSPRRSGKPATSAPRRPRKTPQPGRPAVLAIPQPARPAATVIPQPQTGPPNKSRQTPHLSPPFPGGHRRSIATPGGSPRCSTQAAVAVTATARAGPHGVRQTPASDAREPDRRAALSSSSTTPRGAHHRLGQTEGHRRKPDRPEGLRTATVDATSSGWRAAGPNRSATAANPDRTR